jgi:translation initiation factor 3 subunit A
MSSTWFNKPENALKRANELCAIGNPNAALELLHGVFSARRYKTWQQAYETLMIKYLDLCIDLQKHREAKDGLHQYRNMTQQQMPASLELVVNHLIAASEARAQAAKAAADAISAADDDVTLVGDLEAESTPESIMLSTMTEEGFQERTDRAVVVPWLRFLWEAYRAVLDILKTNTKLESTYHNTCIKAFNFCKVYRRTLEFKRLCETLRQHIQSLQKHSSAHMVGRLRCWEGWTNEGIEMHLQTRFAQLEVAASLELWTEGFRTVEDIYTIMQILRRVPKARLMASYYEKLTRIFFVSGNHLFHAYAWYKYFTLSREYNKALTAEEREQQACCVLLAALSIPEMRGRSGGGSESALDEDDLTKEKNLRMSTLLSFHTDPSRSNLLRELVAKGLLGMVPPALRLLYTQLELSSSPLTLVRDAAPSFEHISAPEHADTLGVYVSQLEHVLIMRVLEGLSERYTTVTIPNFRSYLSGIRLPFEKVEQMVVRIAKSGGVRVSIDHHADVLRFGGAQLETEGVRGQLTQLALQLAAVTDTIRHANGGEAVAQAEAAERHVIFEAVSKKLDLQHKEALARKEIIEKRKEDAERYEQEKAREAARAKAEEEAQRREEEAARLAREARLREREKIQKIEEELAIQETKQVLDRLGKKVDNLDNMDRAEREQVIKSVKDEAANEKEREDRRLRDQARRLDYIVRAIRLEERPVLTAKWTKLQEEDKQTHAQRWKEYQVEHKQEWEQAIKDKAAMKTMMAFRTKFEEGVLESKRADFERNVQAMEDEARERARRARIDRALQRKAEAEEARRLAEEEAERQRRAKDAAEREEEEEEEREREAAMRREEQEDQNRQMGGGRGGDSHGFGGDSRGFGGDSRGFGGESRGFGGETRGFGGESRGFGARSGGGYDQGGDRGYDEGGMAGGRGLRSGGGVPLGERSYDGGFDRGGRPPEPPMGRSDSADTWRRRGPSAGAGPSGAPAGGGWRSGDRAERSEPRPMGDRDGGAPPAGPPKRRWGGGRSLADLEKELGN